MAFSLDEQTNFLLEKADQFYKLEVALILQKFALYRFARLS